MSFELLPAIDLRGGRVVRLVEGDFGRETRYADDPLAVAEGFAAPARPGSTSSTSTPPGTGRGPRRTGRPFARLVGAVGGRMAVEVGGGIRSAAAAEAWLELGVRRVVLGTALLRDPELGATLVRRVGSGRVAAALDVREGAAVGEGWRPGAVAAPVEAILDRLAGVGIETFVVTAIARDGRLGGPDLDLLGRLVHRRRGRIVASGGIAGLADLEAVIRLGCAGAIVGRALYEGRLDLGAALALVDRLGRA
ncbi:MAG: 1-(5-phosphoribosyl)-5-[(5-phosphoribosylamino) methylideneamino] imidazole-4-carboxamide isomerase [Chloroflexota bacterium]|nr:MAG: 1-(5-phosphoribosyl)-5-[(5-phosphoribosylamino) methylideneamino] imidazole-4-carboxamide isomerase [Chloroflexota bacterium]